MMNIVVALITAGILSLSSPCHAAKYLFKIASLAPEGSIWTSHFRDFADEVGEKSNGEIVMKLYPGGVMGDDMAMYRKIRAGQLHGGGFTMTGIASIVPDFRVMAIPFYFNDYTEIDTVSEQLRPFFQKKFQENGLELISLTEVGFIYAFSTSPIVTMADLRSRKSWSPSGDPLTATFLTSLGVTPVQLTIPDVLSSLQTGLIDTVYISLYGAIVMQWFTKATYVTDVPYGYAYGAIAFSEKAFKGLPEKYAQLIHETGDKHFSALNQEIRKSNEESRDVLVNNGVTFLPAASETVKALEESREKTVNKLVGQAFSEEAYALENRIMVQLRATPN